MKRSAEVQSYRRNRGETEKSLAIGSVSPINIESIVGRRKLKQRACRRVGLAL